jgi:hypothetical protein
MHFGKGVEDIHFRLFSGDGLFDAAGGFLEGGFDP